MVASIAVPVVEWSMLGSSKCVVKCPCRGSAPLVSFPARSSLAMSPPACPFDRPGSLGKIGTILGDAGVDILAAGLSQDAEGDGATMMLRISSALTDDVVETISQAVGATLIVQVDLS